MGENTKAGIFILGFGVAAVGGLMHYHGVFGGGDRAEQNSQRPHSLDGFSTTSLDAYIREGSAIDLSQITAPHALVWNSEYNADITCAINTRTWREELFYKGNVIASWNHKTAQIYGADSELVAQGLPAIPLSKRAILKSPLHKKNHDYRSFEEYAWLDAIYPPQSNPDITPPPQMAKYNPSYYVATQKGTSKRDEFLLKREQFQDARYESYEYRRWAQDHAMRVTRKVLDYMPPNAELLRNYTEDGEGYKRENNLYLAKKFTTESSEGGKSNGGIPGPNMYIINSGHYRGLGQMGTQALCSSPLKGFQLEKSRDKAGNVIYNEKNGEPKMHRAYFWTGYEVNGQVIDSDQAYASSFDAQLMAVQHTMHSKWMNKDFVEYAKKNQYGPSGNQGGAHIAGAGNWVEYGGGFKDGNGTAAQTYAKKFDDFPLFPYWNIPRSDKSQQDELPGFTSAKHLSAALPKDLERSQQVKSDLSKQHASRIQPQNTDSQWVNRHNNGAQHNGRGSASSGYRGGGGRS